MIIHYCENERFDHEDRIDRLNDDILIKMRKYVQESDGVICMYTDFEDEAGDLFKYNNVILDQYIIVMDIRWNFKCIHGNILSFEETEHYQNIEYIDQYGNYQKEPLYFIGTYDNKEDAYNMIDKIKEMMNILKNELDVYKFIEKFTDNIRKESYNALKQCLNQNQDKMHVIYY